MNLFSRFKTKLAVWVWNHTTTCAQMARLTSRSCEQPLTVVTRLRMRLHFVVCAWCRRYYKQVNFLHQSAPRLDLELGELPGRGMSAEAKQRITQRIKAEM